MEFRILGSVEILIDGHALPVRRPQQNAVLAALLVDAGRAVPVETLVDRVWSADPPPQARRSLQAHVTRIRRQLLQAQTVGGEPVRLRRDNVGYTLDVAGDRVDLHRFRASVRQARDRARPYGTRLGLLRQALALWRGEPLCGMTGAWAARFREVGRQEYLDAVLAWAQVELSAGNPDVVVQRLVELVDQYPLVEPLAARLMRALQLTERGAEALACYAAVRRRLADELGADPGDELQALHLEVLRGTRPHAATRTPVPLSRKAIRRRRLRISP